MNTMTDTRILAAVTAATIVAEACQQDEQAMVVLFAEHDEPVTPAKPAKTVYGVCAICNYRITRKRNLTTFTDSTLGVEYDAHTRCINTPEHAMFELSIAEAFYGE